MILDKRQRTVLKPSQTKFLSLQLKIRLNTHVECNIARKRREKREKREREKKRDEKSEKKGGEEREEKEKIERRGRGTRQKKRLFIGM